MSWRPFRILLALAMVAAGLLGIVQSGLSQDSAERLAYSIELTGTIDPATERWIDQALGEAEEKDADLAIIRMDTPGGLDTSMRSIIQDIIDAPMPVVVYVSPNGARAASAGLFITQSADVAAMAPQTNIGSATPVMLGGGDTDETLGRKIENDAAAFVRALAEDHGRNGDLAEEMVRDATNVTATEALDANLIDFVSESQEDLLADIDGFAVQGPKAQVLDTEGMVIENRDMPLQFDLLQILVNPTISFLLLSAGFLGIAIEIFGGGGLIFPGVLGAIALLLGLYGTSLLPFTIVGIVLLLAGIGLIIAEVHLPTGGVLGISGVVALVVSGLLLYNTDSEAFEISAPVVILVGVLVGGFILFAMQRVVRAHKRPVHTGWEEMVGAEGEVRVALDPSGQVFVRGARWRAEPAEEGSTIEPGYTVQVEEVDGLTLKVRPVSDDEEATGSQPPAADRAEEGVR
ncbi:MAG: NfeD family protein [Solirubrobacterales bacterium]